jgi:hypothetical protein
LKSGSDGQLQRAAVRVKRKVAVAGRVGPQSDSVIIVLPLLASYGSPETAGQFSEG